MVLCYLWWKNSDVEDHLIDSLSVYFWSILIPLWDLEIYHLRLLPASYSPLYWWHWLLIPPGSSVPHRTNWAPRGAGFLRANPILSVLGEAQEPGTTGRLLHRQAATLHGFGGCGPGRPAQLSLDLSPGERWGTGVRKKGLTWLISCARTS